MTRRHGSKVAPSALAFAAASGVKWLTGATAVVALLAFVQTTIVARLIGPSQYGLMAASYVVIGLGQAFSDAGLGSAVIARPTPDRVMTSLYWLNALAGAVVCLLIELLSPLVAGFYNEPRVGELLRWTALTFVIVPIGAPFGWIMQRELMFRALATIQVVGAVAGTGVAIVTASFGAGVYALAWGLLSSGALVAVLQMGAGWRVWRPRPRLRLSEVRGYLDFGLYQMGERTVNFGRSNVDYMAIGHYLGPALLGTYSIAYSLVTRPLLYINPVVTRVVFPIFAKKNDDNDALQRGYLHVLRVIGYVTIPLLVGIAVMAPEFVDVVLGRRWAASTPIIQVLCAVGIINCLVNPIGAVLLSKNRPDIGFKGNVLALIVTAIAVLIAVHSGLLAVAYGFLIAITLIAMGWGVVVSRVLDLRLKTIAQSLAAPVLLSLTTGLVMLLARGAIGQETDSAAITLAGSVLVGGATYAGLVLRFDAAYVKSLCTVARGPKALANG